MIDEEIYLKSTKLYFEFLVTEYGFSVPKESAVGNAFYAVEYLNTKERISISYENIADYFQVILMLLNDGVVPNYDDKTRTLHLSTLNKFTFKHAVANDIAENEKWFSSFNPIHDMERELLKAAKELRLYFRTKGKQ